MIVFVHIRQQIIGSANNSCWAGFRLKGLSFWKTHKWFSPSSCFTLLDKRGEILPSDLTWPAWTLKPSCKLILWQTYEPCLIMEDFAKDTQLQTGQTYHKCSMMLCKTLKSSVYRNSVPIKLYTYLVVDFRQSVLFQELTRLKKICFSASGE